MEEHKNTQAENPSEENDKKGRRDALKSLAALPVVGIFFYNLWKKNQHDDNYRKKLLEELHITAEAPVYPKADPNEDPIRLGIIGFGIRGKQLAKAAGFSHPKQIDNWKEQALKNKTNNRLESFLAQEDLNVVVTGVCDIFTVYAKEASEAAANINREGTGGSMGDNPTIYRTYQELLAAADIDAVIIATPDHWHGPMTIAAANAGKHVYCEKPLTWTVEETYEVRKAVKENNVTFQLGHQNRQTEAYFKAKDALQKNAIGKVNLIEITTNRNSKNGAWVYKIHPEASPETIDWEQFIGQAPWHDFNLERFFRWRCWWDYSTGLSGDLLTHEYDCMNQIFEFGIPNSAVSSGGIYHFKDGRTVPDVLHTVFEYPEQDLTMMYSATLASNKSRGRVIMGHDGYLELGKTVQIYADRQSTRYKEKIKNGTIDPNVPIYSYLPGRKNVDAVTSATEQYFAARGLLYTYRGGQRVDAAHLHIKEWLSCIRSGDTPSCNIDQAFEEAMTAHMGTMAYKENRKVFWDKENEKIV